MWREWYRLTVASNGWTHMLLDVTGQMRYCCRRSRCFLISDTFWHPRVRFFFFSLAFFVLHEIPTGSEKYPLLSCTSKKHYHMLFRNAPASRQKVQQTKEPYEKRSYVISNTACSGFPEVSIRSICSEDAICQILGHDYLNETSGHIEARKIKIDVELWNDWNSKFLLFKHYVNYYMHIILVFIFRNLIINTSKIIVISFFFGESGFFKSEIIRNKSN